MSFATLAIVLQVAVFGAAGTSFLSAHLKNMAADRLSRSEASGVRWRMFRLPHRRLGDPPAARALRRAALVQTLWGAAFLAGAFLIQTVIGAAHFS